MKYKIAFATIVLLLIIIIPTVASERFIDNGDGTISDTQTGLMWAGKDNGKPINWKDSWQYCKNYRGGGYADWRMPTLLEIQTLYDPTISGQGKYPTIKLIKTSAQSLWAAETRGFEAARFNFTYGRTYWLRKTYSGPTRILPVRNIISPR